RPIPSACRRGHSGEEANQPLYRLAVGWVDPVERGKPGLHEDGPFIGEGLEPVHAAVPAHPAGADASERQFVRADLVDNVVDGGGPGVREGKGPARTIGAVVEIVEGERPWRGIDPVESLLDAAVGEYG